MSSFIITP